MKTKPRVAVELGDELIHDGTTYAYQYQTTSGEFVFQCPKSGIVRQETDTDLERALSEKRFRPATRMPPVTVAGKPKSFTKSFMDYRKDHRDIALDRMDYVKAINDRGQPSPQRTQWPEIIAAVGDRKGVTKLPAWETVRTWVYDYEDHGRDIRALIPDFCNRGRNFVVLDDEAERLLTSIVETYKRSSRTTAAAIIRRVKDQFLDAINKDSRKKDWPIPGDEMIQRRIKELCPYEVALGRYGEKAADDVFKMAKQGTIARHRLDLVELDHTTSNCLIVDDERKVILGRPTFGASMDRHTRMMMGLYIGFKRPSEFTLMQTMRDMILPKDYIQREFPEIRNKMIGYGKPVVLVLDNALENHGLALRNAGAILGIDVRFAKIRNPEFKGVIERFFHTMEIQGLTWATGRTFTNVVERGKEKIVAEQCMTLREFRRHIYDWVINHYSCAWHRGINAAPADKWEEAVAEMPIRLSDIDAQLVDDVLGRVGLYTVNKRGIRIDGLIYQSRELHSIMKLPKGEREVAVTRFHENVGYIDVRHPRDGRVLRVPCNHAEANNLTIDQNRAIQAIGRKRGQRYMNREEFVSARVESYRRADEIYNRRNAKATEKLAAAKAKGGDLVIQPRTEIAGTSPMPEPDLLAEMTSRKPNRGSTNEAASGGPEDTFETGDDL